METSLFQWGTCFPGIRHCHSIRASHLVFPDAAGWQLSLDNLSLQHWIGPRGTIYNHGEPGVLLNPKIYKTAWNSIRLSLWTALFTAFFGVLLGYAIVKGRGTRLSKLVEQLAFLPYVIPGIAFGAVYIAMFVKPLGPLSELYGTFTLLVLVSIADKIPLSDFFEFARRIGFARIELNHKVTSAMLERAGLEKFQCSSVHEPCPADISTDELKRRDWLISSTNEENRREGVKAIQRSTDLASRLGASAMVIHAGTASAESGLEKKLRVLYASGKSESDEYREIQRQMIQVRAEGTEAGFEAVRKSIFELLAYSEPLRVRLGIENRYHYMEFPNPDELKVLLSLAGPDRIGFLYDVGHAETLDRLGFYRHEEWLKRFSPRIIGTHLYDVLGTTDHYAPGLGTVDFDRVAAYLPDEAFRTCEFQNTNTPEQVKAGLQYLAAWS